jgi:RNA polymerase sigma-70 factor (ECF subfamily)
MQTLPDLRDESTWNPFIEHVGSLLFAVCFRILGNRQLAEDAVQETWNQIVLNVHTFDDSQKVEAWLVRIV